jgi:hypothetical protein
MAALLELERVSKSFGAGRRAHARVIVDQIRRDIGNEV